MTIFGVSLLTWLLIGIGVLFFGASGWLLFTAGMKMFQSIFARAVLMIGGLLALVIFMYGVGVVGPMLPKTFDWMMSRLGGAEVSANDPFATIFAGAQALLGDVISVDSSGTTTEADTSSQDSGVGKAGCESITTPAGVLLDHGTPNSDGVSRCCNGRWLNTGGAACP